MWVFLIILVILIVLLVILIKRSKKFRFDSIVMINGGVGSGKTLTAVWLAIRSYKKSVRIWKRKNFFRLLFNKEPKEEKPMLYSNIPLYNIDFVLISQELLERGYRFAFHSVVLISESSLIANSQDFKNRNFPKLNDNLTEFLKLIRHELHGSYRSLFGFGGTIPNLIVETQSKNDNHYAFDRCITQTLFISESYNIPFFKLQHCREFLLVESVENIIQDDLKDDKSFKWYLIPKRYFNKYDSYVYSFLTDNLPKYDDYIHIEKKKRQRKKIQFIIATFHLFDDIALSNDELKKINEKCKVIDYIQK